MAAIVFYDDGSAAMLKGVNSLQMIPRSWYRNLSKLERQRVFLSILERSPYVVRDTGQKTHYYVPCLAVVRDIFVLANRLVRVKVAGIHNLAEKLQELDAHLVPYMYRFGESWIYIPKYSVAPSILIRGQREDYQLHPVREGCPILVFRTGK